MSYNYCLCKNPKKKKNEANGQSFEVCAKSLGGCGREIGRSLLPSDLDNIHWDKSKDGDRATTWTGGKIANIKNATGQCITITPVPEEECPECYGGGFIAKLYPSGHTEARCDNCNGTGKIEKDDTF